MSPAPATSLLLRRGRIRNKARAGQSPREIARELRFGTRTVLSVLAMPETDLERDAADLLAGWSPDCMDLSDWTHWQRMNPANVGGGKALKPCWDCPLEFAVEMRGEDRCNGSPGRPTGRPVREAALIALPELPEPKPIDVFRAQRQAFVRQTDAAVAEVLAAGPPPEEEPAMPDDPETETTTPAVDEPAPRVELEQALEALASRATAAAGAWSEKAAADQAWEDARAALEDAWMLVARGQELDLGQRHLHALGNLVEDAEQAIELGVLEEARASVALDDETQAVVLSGLKAGQSRADIARELKVTYLTVDGIIEAMARKGQFPPEVFPLLPARFAKYATVASR